MKQTPSLITLYIRLFVSEYLYTELRGIFPAVAEFMEDIGVSFKDGMFVLDVSLHVYPAMLEPIMSLIGVMAPIMSATEGSRETVTGEVLQEFKSKLPGLLPEFGNSCYARVEVNGAVLFANLPTIEEAAA